MPLAAFFDTFFYDAILVLALSVIAGIGYFKYSYTYWKKKNVPYLQPSFPYGNYMFPFPRSSTFAGEAAIWYKEFKKQGHKFGGTWIFARPVLVLIDPDYIRDILTKDFHYFVNRDIYVNEKDVRGTHLFNIRADGWKPLRQKLTPTFTSGKMKMMFNSVLKCSDFMIDYLEKCTKINDDIDIREVLASFTTDVIFCVAFGVDSNSFDGTHTEFRQQGKNVFKFDLKIIPKFIMITTFPELSRKLGIAAGKEETKNFFGEVVKNTIEYRRKNNVRRPDFLQLLIDMNENSKDNEKPFSLDEIVANTILFFIAGFDTSSSVMNFSLYQLARNPEIQEKTREEIKNVLQKHGGEITYEAIQDMTYLMQVMDETMRLFPPLIALARMCTKDYQLRDTNIIIEKGTPVAISTLGLGNDPEYFPNPEKFDPDRFSPENKAKLHPYVHIPFGQGPRNCIGLRFGVMQSKIGLVRILSKFKLSISPKTKLPLTVDPTRFLLKSNETLYLKAEKM